MFIVPAIHIHPYPCRYMYLDWHHTTIEQGIVLTWLQLISRQAGCAFAWLGGATIMHALMLEGFGLKAKDHHDDDDDCVSCISSTSSTSVFGRITSITDALISRLESGLLQLKKALSPQDRTLVLAVIMAMAPISCFIKCIA